MADPIRIQRKRTKGWRKPEGAVIVDRISRWGNPYKVGGRYFAFQGDYTTTAEVRDNAHAVELFIERKIRFLPDIEQLPGKYLFCWCPLDQPCHADVLLELANAISGKT